MCEALQMNLKCDVFPHLLEMTCTQWHFKGPEKYYREGTRLVFSSGCLLVYLNLFTLHFPLYILNVYNKR